MPKTYRVYFIDAISGGYNQMLLEGDIRDVVEYVCELGHEIYKLEVA